MTTILSKGLLRSHVTTRARTRATTTATKTTLFQRSAAVSTQQEHCCFQGFTTLSSSSSFSSSSNADIVDDAIRSLPWQYLRAADLSNYDPMTHQRCDVPFDTHSGKVGFRKEDDEDSSTVLSIQAINPNTEDSSYSIVWSDGKTTKYSKSWLEQEARRWNNEAKLTTTNAVTNDGEREFWSGLTEDGVRGSNQLSVDFNDLIHNETGMSRAIKSLYKYGIVLIQGTPVDEEGGEAAIAALGAAVSGGQIKAEPNSSLLANYRQNSKTETVMLPHGTDGPLRTLYGTLWSTTTAGQSDGASVADSAYGNDGLPLHTDMTYMRDPPGLQIFTMRQKAVVGGESTFGDGFAVAERLRESNPKAFDVLSQTPRTYRCIDKDTGWNLQATGPVIQLDPFNSHKIVQIRHNDLDRLPDLPPREIIDSGKADEWYADLREASQAWDELISSDEFRLVIQLQPGETMVVHNQVRLPCFLHVDRHV